MNFALTEEQKMIQETCRDFARTELAPQAARLDETKDRTILLKNLKKMAELGLMGMNIPEAYGGAQVGVVAYFALALGKDRIENDRKRFKQ